MPRRRCPRHRGRSMGCRRFVVGRRARPGRVAVRLGREFLRRARSHRCRWRRGRSWQAMSRRAASRRLSGEFRETTDRLRAAHQPGARASVRAVARRRCCPTAVRLGPSRRPDRDGSPARRYTSRRPAGCRAARAGDRRDSAGSAWPGRGAAGPASANRSAASGSKSGAVRRTSGRSRAGADDGDRLAHGLSAA